MRVALFVTCLVDLFRPTVGFAAVRLLRRAGCEVEVPRAQTCCGQPAFNAGAREHARAVAAGVVDAFAAYEHVVAPSGSCAGMIRNEYPELLADDPARADAARRLAGRTRELTEFLVDVLGVDATGARFEGPVTFHDSCSSLRELGVRDQPRHLLRSVEGLELRELAEPEVCCGFGGTFCVKYPEISNRMVERKAEDAEATGAAMLLSGDMGCLLNIAGKLGRRGSPVAARHVAEVLAGMADEPPIGGTGGADGR